eukprot:CAMPEP_0202363620 /NCGR_PEP_ID=MMETSP1126-20121109/15336_1 /ASSEMBLY_ACC=CAM_ASM_000457 /TAXON_ID=3047 /ORGANISM="Dunaliella tertiolecta, Strain CCMP1320" /LENGTH=51 /DNA_ID=CAMNT_0048958061 /DNA_START=98 /DNA_END=250 /DNA_ORIENTATION=-
MACNAQRAQILQLTQAPALVDWYNMVCMPSVALHCLRHQPVQVGLVVALHK